MALGVYRVVCRVMGARRRPQAPPRLARSARRPATSPVTRWPTRLEAHGATRRPPPTLPSAPQLLAGAKPDERSRWRLGPSAAAHRLTAGAGCLELPGVDDAADLARTRHAMRSVGLAPSDQEQIFRLLAALLHLADVQLDPCPKSDGEGCALGPRAAASLAAASELLGCDAGALRKAVTTRTRQTPDGPIVSPLTPKAAVETRDALSKVGPRCVTAARVRTRACLCLCLCRCLCLCEC